MSSLRPFVLLGLTTLIFLWTSSVAAQVAPPNGTVFKCDRNSDWETVEFKDLPTAGNLRRGVILVKPPRGQADNKKVTLAWRYNSRFWVFTLPRDGVQCKEMIFFESPYGVERLVFTNCEGTTFSSLACRK